MGALTVHHELLQSSHDVSKLTFPLSACALKCQDAFVSGGVESSAAPCEHPDGPGASCGGQVESSKRLMLSGFTDTEAKGHVVNE